jgi:hypothetical protein
MRKWILGTLGALLLIGTSGAEAQNITNRNPTSPFVLDQRTNPNVICIPRDNSSGLCNGNAAPNVFATWDGTTLNFGLGVAQNALILAEQNRATAAEAANANSITNETTRAIGVEATKPTIGDVERNVWYVIDYISDKATHAYGTADDYGPISSALAACAAQGGGMVYLGPHFYYSSQTLNPTNGCALGGMANVLQYVANVPEFYRTEPYTILSSASPAIQVGSIPKPDATGGLVGINVMRANLPQATDMQSALAKIAAFSGTGVLMSHNAPDSKIENVVIGGFNLCMDIEPGRPRINHVMGDCTNGALFNTVTDYSYIQNVEWQPFMTGGVPGADSPLTVTGLASDGAGQVQLTVTNTAIATQLVNGNTVRVGGLGRRDLDGPWTIGNVVVGASSTTFSLVGSTFGASSFTGNITAGSPYITGVSAADMKKLGTFTTGTAMTAPGVTDAGSSFPAGAYLLWTNPDTGTAQMSANATATLANDNLTSTPTAYGGAGSANFGVIYRSGYGYRITNSQGMFLTNVFDFGHQVEFDIGTGSQWAQISNYGCDGSPTATDPTRICINISDTAQFATFNQGTIVDAGIAIKQNTTGAGSGAGFRSVVGGPTTVFNNEYLGTELLSGGMVIGPEVVFRSTQPNFIGDSAVVNMMATQAQTANPQTIYQSAASPANAISGIVGSFSATGNAAFGPGEVPPASGIQVLATGDTNPGLRVDSTTAGAASNVQLTPFSLMQRRSSGSQQGFRVGTASGSGYANAGGSVGLQALGVDAFVCQPGTTCVASGGVVDASASRVALVPTGYTVPANRTKVRFIQTAAVTATITLPSTYAVNQVLPEGYSIQFVNEGAGGSGGAITASFSPAIPGIANPVTIPAFSGFRVSWDATAGAWAREQ